MELAPAAGIVADDLAFSGEEVFVGDKAFEADGTAGVELAGADADFGTKAVAEAVREAGGAVAVDTGGVDHLLEARRGCIVTGEDGVGVVGAVAIDVVYGLFDIGDHFEGDNEIQILCAEIFVLHDIDGVDLDQYTLVDYAPGDAAVTDSKGTIIAHETDENGRNILTIRKKI